MLELRVDWSYAEITLVASMGVHHTEVDQVLAATGRRLLQRLTDDDGNDEGWRVISDASGRLVEVWLSGPTRDGWYRVIGAFEAGLGGATLWRKTTKGELQ